MSSSAAIHRFPEEERVATGRRRGEASLMALTLYQCAAASKGGSPRPPERARHPAQPAIDRAVRAARTSWMNSER
jgi:hypothetical protein